MFDCGLLFLRLLECVDGWLELCWSIRIVLVDFGLVDATASSVIVAVYNGHHRVGNGRPLLSMYRRRPVHEGEVDRWRRTRDVLARWRESKSRRC